MNPRARKDGLVIRELNGELLVYDLERHRAHCLNPTAALVFKQCDGRTSPARMARALRETLDAPADEKWVSFALDRLAKAHLLEGESALPLASRSLSRRDLVRRAGQIAGLALLLPAVTSIVAPTPAEAAATCVTSCAGKAFGTPCRNSNPSDCGIVCICDGGGNCTQLDGITPCP
jgi:coenzyme PQQ synthesis protein D (PqqD)